MNIHLNVDKENDSDQACNLIEKEAGRIDILLHNAAITGIDGDFGPQNPEYASLDSWKRIHEVNLDGVFLGWEKATGVVRIPGAAV